MLQRLARLMVFALTGLLSFGTVAQACGVKDACLPGDRQYYIQMSPGHDGQTVVPALVFLHGYKGSGLSSMR